MPEVGDIWYRYEDIQYAAPLDEWGDPVPGGAKLKVELRQFTLQRITPKGVWLGYGRVPRRGSSRFQLHTSHKKYACPTIEEARESFIARKRRQAGIYRAKADRAERAMDILIKGGHFPF